MKKHKILTILTLILLAVTLGTGTYAWIGLSRVVMIPNIKMVAGGEADLEVSLDGIHYSKHIDVKNYQSDILKQVKYSDVTSFNGVDFTHGIQSKLLKENVDYLKLVFHFRTTNQHYIHLYLTDLIENANYHEPPLTGTYITSKGIEFKSTTDFKYSQTELVNQGNKRLYYVKDALRVSTNELTTSGITKIFDLSGNQERGYGTTFGALDYYNQTKGTDIKPPKEIPNTIYQLSQLDLNNPYALSDVSKIGTLIKSDDLDQTGKTYYKSSIEVRIWIEGWDSDAFDSILGDHFIANFQFTALVK